MAEEATKIDEARDFEATVRIRYGSNQRASTCHWDVPPTCRCGWLKSAFEGDAIFVQDVMNPDETGKLYNFCYVHIVAGDGELADAGRGTHIRYCPRCGDPLKVRKS
jgi:hypothetical protein